MPRPPRHLALGYIRVSSYLGRDRGDALTEDLQLEKIQQWCAVADLELVDVLRDVDKSGKDVDGRGRPAFAELLRRLEAGEASALVVYRMSRFGRDFYETIRTVRRLRDQGIQFHSASERIDLDSPNGRLMFNVLASFDEYELDIRREPSRSGAPARSCERLPLSASRYRAGWSRILLSAPRFVGRSSSAPPARSTRSSSRC